MRGLPESFGELPATCLAEEIEAPGEGQVHALITIAGNTEQAAIAEDRRDTLPGRATAASSAMPRPCPIAPN